MTNTCACSSCRAPFPSFADKSVPRTGEALFVNLDVWWLDGKGVITGFSMLVAKWAFWSRPTKLPDRNRVSIWWLLTWEIVPVIGTLYACGMSGELVETQRIASRRVAD